MKKKITLVIALLCIMSILTAFVACDGEGKDNQPSGSVSSGEIESGLPSGNTPSGDIPSGNLPSGNTPGGDSSSDGNQYPDGTVVIEGDYQLPQIDDSKFDYSGAFIIENDTVIGLTEYGKTLPKLVVPSGVTAIGDYAFASDEDTFFDGVLKYVELPYGVKSIGEGAFMLNLNLLSVNLPESLISIGDYAFQLCSSLTELIIPDSIEEIGESQFIHCSSLVIKTKNSDVISDLKNNQLVPTEFESEYLIPIVYNCQNNEIADDGYTYVITDDGIVYGLKDGIAKVKGHAYLDGDVTISDYIAYKGNVYKVEEIGDYAFIEMHAITNIDLPNGVKTIGNLAFGGCEGISSLVLPNSLNQIGSLAFKGCANLEIIEIPSEVESVGEEAFGDCYALTKVVFKSESNLITIGANAFLQCDNLTSITIPISVTSMGAHAFAGCSSLTICCEAESQPSEWDSNWNSSNRPVIWGYDGSEINPPSGDDRYPDGTVVIDEDFQLPQIDDSEFDYSGAFIIENDTVIGLTEYGKTLPKLVVPSGVTAIGDYALGSRDDYVTTLKAVELPDSVTSIGEGAFIACAFLESVSLPDGLKSIGDYAFQLCTCLTELKIPDSVESIGKEAFVCCNTLVIKISGERIISDLADNLTFLTEVNTEYRIPVLYNYLNNEIADDGYIYVIADNGIQYALKDGIAKVTGHTYISGDIVIASNVAYKGKLYQVQRIEDFSFVFAIDVTSITIKNGVTSIGAGAFITCFMENIELPDSLQTIGQWAFNGCDGLQNIIIPSGVTKISVYAISSCENLKSITIPSTVIDMEEDAIAECNKVTIYCEADSQPSEWDVNWNSYGRPVVWGHTMSN